jgi:transposase
MAEEQSRRRRQFTEEFKRDAVDLVRATGRPIAQIAQELGSMTPRWATGSVRIASTAASAKA